MATIPSRFPPLSQSGGTITGDLNVDGQITGFSGFGLSGSALIEGDEQVNGALNLSNGAAINFGNPAGTGSDLYLSGTNTLTTDKDLVVAGAIHSASISGSTQPPDMGLVSWAYDPVQTSSTTTSVAGTIYLTQVPIRYDVNVTQIWFIINSSGSGATAGANNVGLYNSSGTLLASANVDANVASSGPHAGTISSTALTPGFYWVAMQFTATGQPGLGRANAAILSSLTLNQTAATYRFATNGSGVTLPATITPASNSTTGSAALWAGVA